MDGQQVVCPDAYLITLAWLTKICFLPNLVNGDLAWGLLERVLRDSLCHLQICK